VPKLLSDDQKQQPVEICIEFVTTIHHRSLAMLDSILTMDKTIICYHTPQKKQCSIGQRRVSWAHKGQVPCQLDQTDVAGFLQQ
jgi:hypothetical protein